MLLNLAIYELGDKKISEAKKFRVYYIRYFNYWHFAVCDCIIQCNFTIGILP